MEVGIVLLIFAEFCGQLAMISSDILEKFGKFAARLSGKNPAILVSSTSDVAGQIYFVAQMALW